MLCLSKVSSWISNVICRAWWFCFVFSELRWEVIVRFCLYWWDCWRKWGPGFPTSFVVVCFMFSQVRWEVIGRGVATVRHFRHVPTHNFFPKFSLLMKNDKQRITYFNYVCVMFIVLMTSFHKLKDKHLQWVLLP